MKSLRTSTDSFALVVAVITIAVLMAPAADMFEMGVEVQVLKRGTLFGVRARKLYDLYRRHESLDVAALAAFNTRRGELQAMAGQIEDTLFAEPARECADSERLVKV